MQGCVSLVIREIEVCPEIAKHLRMHEGGDSAAGTQVLTRTSSSFPFNAATCSAVFPSTFAQSRMSGYRS